MILNDSFMTACTQQRKQEKKKRKGSAHKVVRTFKNHYLISTFINAKKITPQLYSTYQIDLSTSLEIIEIRNSSVNVLECSDPQFLTTYCQALSLALLSFSERELTKVL